MINEQSKIVNVKIVDLGKKVPLPPRNGTLNGRDKNNNTLAMDQVVKVVEGPQRGMNGTIRHGHITAFHGVSRQLKYLRRWAESR